MKKSYFFCRLRSASLVCATVGATVPGGRTRRGARRLGTTVIHINFFCIFLFFKKYFKPGPSCSPAARLYCADGTQICPDQVISIIFSHSQKLPLFNLHTKTYFRFATRSPIARAARTRATARSTIQKEVKQD